MKRSQSNCLSGIIAASVIIISTILSTWRIVGRLFRGGHFIWRGLG